MLISWASQQPGFRFAPTALFDFTTGSLDSRVTFTRASVATYFNSAGVMSSAGINTARFDHDPTTLAVRGLLLEEQRTNLLLNSLLNGTNLSTQSVTVSATSYTLSFFGTGTVTLSGASTAGPLVGTGATNKVSLTFTPIAGMLTLTVSGTVKWANLEAGSFATSFIPTAGAFATRAADLALVTGTNFSSWYNQTEGTFVVDFMCRGPTVAQRILGLSDGTTDERIRLFVQTSTQLRALVVDGGVTQTILDNTTTGLTNPHKAALAVKANDFVMVSDGGAPATGASGTMPTPNLLALGSYEGGSAGNHINGWIKRLSYYNSRLSNTKLQELTM